MGFKRKRRKNGVEESRGYQAAKTKSEQFHGRPSRGFTDVTRVIKFSKNLAQLGLLECLEIIDDQDESKVQEINFDHDKVEGVPLACTPDGNQLLIPDYIELEPNEAENVQPDEWNKHKVLIGECLAVCYFADKHHLQGPKSQANGTGYRHEFGEKTGIRPFIVYDTVNKVLEFVGGSYTVEDVGIVG